MPNKKINILEVKNIKKYYPVRRGLFSKVVNWIKAVDGVSFFLEEGKTLGLVGESGCGKTTLAKVILGLLDSDEGSICFSGQEVTRRRFSKNRGLRKDLQIVFQNPFNSLDSRFTILRVIQEGLVNFTPKKAKREIIEQCKKILSSVGISHEAIFHYPHQFSGGERQRISIARSLVFNPRLLVLDEPISSLDISIQGQILNLLLDLQKEMGLSYLFIAHDLNVIKSVCDRVCVMYLGKVMEIGDVKDIFECPSHPYTRVLLSAVPKLDLSEKSARIMLQGETPSPINPPSGCRFHPRCLYAQNICREQEPGLTLRRKSDFVACHFPLGYF